MDAMTYRYPLKRLAGDYVRAGAGLLLTAMPLLLLSLSPLPFAILLFLAVLFMGYGVHTAFCHRRRINVNEDQISTEPDGVCLNWRDLGEVKLEYYSTRKEAATGWMQMTLRSRKKRLRIDSRLEGFQDIARYAATRAHANDLFLSQTTATNLAALGIEVDGTTKVGTERSGG